MMHTRHVDDLYLLEQSGAVHGRQNAVSSRIDDIVHPLIHTQSVTSCHTHTHSSRTHTLYVLDRTSHTTRFLVLSFSFFGMFRGPVPAGGAESAGVKSRGRGTMPLSPREVTARCRLPLKATVSKGFLGRTDEDSLAQGDEFLLLYSTRERSFEAKDR